MFCQTCGTECQPGLNYCHRCGAAINTSALTSTHEIVPVIPVDLGKPMCTLGKTIGLTTVFGFAVLFGGMSILASWGVRGDAISAIAFFGLLTILSIDLSLIRLMSRVISAPQATGRKARFKRSASAVKEFEPAPYVPALAERAPSVTEHTTRTFSPVYKEPRA